MTQRTFTDPVLELAHKLGCGPEAAVLDFADMTDEEAETAIEVLDEVDAEENARHIGARLRAQGHLL